MKLLTTSALVCVFSIGTFGVTGAMADGISTGAGVRVVGPQVTREISTRTSSQVSSAASQATREAQTK